MKRKLLLGLGSLAAFAPVVAVVACGKIANPDSTQLDYYRRLTSTQTSNILEEKWIEKVMQDKQYTDLGGVSALPAKGSVTAVDGVINADGVYVKTGLYKLDVANNAKLKEAAYFILRNEIAKDKQYLTKLSTSLLSGNVKTWADWDNKDGKSANATYLAKIGLNKMYEYGNLPIAGPSDITASGIEFNNSIGLSNEAYNILLNFNMNDFRLKVYKQLISEAYLGASKEQYTKAFVANGRNLTQIQTAIKEDEFVFTNEVLAQKLFAQWNITLDKEASAGFYSKAQVNISAVKTAFQSGGDLYTKANFSAKQSFAREYVLGTANGGEGAATERFLINNSYDNMIGWKSYVNQSSQGSKTLSFTFDELKKVTSLSTWEGIIQNDDLISSGIKYVDRDNKQDSVNITFARGFMPTYKSDKFTMTDWDQNQRDEMKRLLAYKSSGLYKTASEYFRTEVKDENDTVTKEAIYLDTTDNKDIDSILKGLNFEFNQKRTAE